MLPNGSCFAPHFLPDEADDFAQVADDRFECRDHFGRAALRIGKVVARFQRLVEGTAECHGQGVFDRAVNFGERMSDARVTPSAGWSCLWL